MLIRKSGSMGKSHGSFEWRQHGLWLYRPSLLRKSEQWVWHRREHPCNLVTLLCANQASCRGEGSIKGL